MCCLSLFVNSTLNALLSMVKLKLERLVAVRCNKISIKSIFSNCEYKIYNKPAFHFLSLKIEIIQICSYHRLEIMCNEMRKRRHPLTLNSPVIDSNNNKRTIFWPSTFFNLYFWTLIINHSGAARIRL